MEQQNGNSVHLQKERGALIVLEGLDRSGKSTQAKLLLEHLQRSGQPACVQRFPDRDEPTTGPVIDTFLRNAKSVDENKEAIHLIFSANRWLTAAQMRQRLTRGEHIIVDRYSHSGIAYSLAKGMNRQWACRPEVGLPRPDLVLFFDIDPEKTSGREGFGEEVMERSEFQQLVYRHMSDLFDESYWRRIDAGRTIEEVHRSVVGEVSQLLRNLATQNSPLEDFSSIDLGI